MNLEFSKGIDDRFAKHFSAQMDDVTLVLKSHLLLEEMLRGFCFEMVSQPHFLENSRLTFAQVLDLSQALYPNDLKLGRMVELWSLASKINRMRNMMAHALDPDLQKLSGHRDSIISSAKSRFKGSENWGFPACLAGILGAMNFVLQAGITHTNGENPLHIPRK